MKEFKGTPAPWSLPHFADNSCSCDCGFILVEGHCGAVATVHYSKDNSIKNGDNPLPEQCIANASLIAAAPDLLEALHRLIIAAKPHCVSISQLNMRVKEAEAAISKALTLNN